jgi:hypothetical protein
MMNMDQLFRALPRDLQWEVLTEFTGTHTVRKGKLRRKMVFDAKHQMVQDMPRIQTIVSPGYTQAITRVELSYGQGITCFQSPNGKDTYYMFVSNRPYDPTRSYLRGKFITKVLPPESSVDLPPFVKHSYPSYEHTDKKKKKKL